VTLHAARSAVVGLIAGFAVLAYAGAILIGRHGQDSHAMLFGLPRTAVGVGAVGLGLAGAVALAIVWALIQRMEPRHD
jgi:hypothetical protein